MAGQLFGGFKRVLTTVAPRMLTPTASRGRGAVAVNWPTCQRTLATTTRLASRESDLHGIAMHNRPSNLDKKLLVLTRVYKSQADVPDLLPITQINRARDKIRITVSISIMVAFLIAVPFYMSSGRKQRDRGDTEWKRSKQWVEKLRRDKLAEEEARKQAASSSS